MHERWFLYVFLAALFVAYRVYRRLNQVSGEHAKKLVGEGARLVDVRTQGEFASGHLDGAVNVPLNELAAGLEKLGAKDKPLVLYCASGARSARARSVLRQKGFTQVFDLGAMHRWP